MTSEYLRREIRDRLAITRDMSLGMQDDWYAIGALADGLDVMFAVSGMRLSAPQPAFLYVSNYSWTLTGHWPNELQGQDPKILQCAATNRDEAQRFMRGLTENGTSEVALVNQRKSGELYGCHILAVRIDRPRIPPSMPQDIEAPIYFAFLSECAIPDCPSAPAQQ